MMLLLHPREATLLRYAAGSAKETARRQVASHLADCDRCRGTVQSTRELRATLASGGAVGAPDPLLQRILQSRVQGERVILPVEAPVLQPGFAAPNTRVGQPTIRPAFWLVLTGVAVAAVAVVGSDRYEKSLVARMGGSAASFAARAPRLKLDPKVPSAGPFAAARLRPVQLRYGQVRYSASGPLESVQSSALRFVRSGTPGSDWIAITTMDTREGGPDSIWINGETLEPAQWREKEFYKRGGSVSTYRMHGNEIAVDRRFKLPTGVVMTRARADSLARTWGSSDTTYSLAEPHPTILLNQAHLIVAMMASPLAVGWQGAFAYVSVGRKKASTYGKRTIRITGTRQIVTPAGVFDCWEALLRTDNYERLQWYRKSDGLFVGESYGTRNDVMARTLLLSE